MAEPLKLRATDAEDIAVLSSCMQDAVVPLRDIAWLPDERRFVLVASRFRWEEAAGERVEGRIYERVKTGFRVEDVVRVQRRGIDVRDPGRMLSLLAIAAEDDTIELVFSGGVSIRLSVARILCQIEDIGEPWPTQWRPLHGDGT
ncbi:MAG: DUF2948 family protein [Alphaproteobacteria bacterium]|nr:DUF2948 family protein [Alphaproteobacteria bacterium]